MTYDKPLETERCPQLDEMGAIFGHDMELFGQGWVMVEERGEAVGFVRPKRPHRLVGIPLVAPSPASSSPASSRPFRIRFPSRAAHTAILQGERIQSGYWEC